MSSACCFLFWFFAAKTDSLCFFFSYCWKKKPKKNHTHAHREDAQTRNTNLAGAPTCGSLLSAAAAVWIITQPEAGKALHWSKQAFSVSHSGRLWRFLLEDSLPPPPGSCSRSRRGQPCLRWPLWIINPSQNLLTASICLFPSCLALRRSHDMRSPRQHDYWLTCRAKFRLLPGMTRIRAPSQCVISTILPFNSSVFMRLSTAPGSSLSLPASLVFILIMHMDGKVGQVRPGFWNAGQN